MNYEEAIKYLSLNEGLNRVMGKKSLYSRILNMFLKSEEPAKLRAAVEANDINACNEISHAIKGMAGNLALVPLFNCVTNLNNLLKTGVLDKKIYSEYESLLEATIEAINVIIPTLV